MHKMTTKKEFRAAFISYLTSKNLPVDLDKINSALTKMALHSMCFYNEYKVKATFNRESRKNNISKSNL